MMKLKTEDRYSYNEDDFMQCGENMQELTVTITLCEYRNLVRDIVHQDNAIEKLEKENKELREQLDACRRYIIANNPELVEKIIGCANTFANASKPDQTTEEGGEE